MPVRSVPLLLGDIAMIGSSVSTYMKLKKSLAILDSKMKDGSILPHEKTLLRDAINGMDALSKLSGQQEED